MKFLFLIFSFLLIVSCGVSSDKEIAYNLLNENINSNFSHYDFNDFINIESHLSENGFARLFLDKNSNISILQYTDGKNSAASLNVTDRIDFNPTAIEINNHKLEIIGVSYLSDDARCCPSGKDIVIIDISDL